MLWPWWNHDSRYMVELENLIMSHHFDAFEQAMQDAQQRVITAGMSGGNVHETIDTSTVIMASMSWAVQRIEASNAKLAKEMTGNGDSTVRDRIKKGGPAAGVGAAVVAVLAYLREFF